MIFVFRLLSHKFMPVLRSSFIQRMIQWRFLIVLNAFLIIFLGISFGREIIRNHSIGSEIAHLQQQADSLVAQNIEISELKTAIQTESYIEREARLKLGMKKPGETVYIIQQEQDPSQTQITDNPNDPLGLVLTDSEETMAVANPTKWWYYFFDKQSYNTFSHYER
ncbi:TPA: hypothetical protein DCW61_02630 [Candidatus Uhrbacteria bacterium]|nr:hypothetical protein [Candidatus Uhrbacteria bacterium]